MMFDSEKQELCTRHGKHKEEQQTPWSLRDFKPCSYFRRVQKWFLFMLCMRWCLVFSFTILSRQLAGLTQKTVKMLIVSYTQFRYLITVGSPVMLASTFESFNRRPILTLLQLKSSSWMIFRLMSCVVLCLGQAVSVSGMRLPALLVVLVVARNNVVSRVKLMLFIINIFSHALSSCFYQYHE